jgi:hypothetical protein
MTPQQYDRINGLNALGGCMLMVCIFGVFPVVLAVSHSIGLAIVASVGLSIATMLLIGQMKADV